jgi:hypothetical protein
MGDSDKPHPATAKVPESGTTLVLFATIADTTWRMFMPVLVLLGLGWWLDNETGHKPWFLISGVFIGFGLGIALVYQQYRQVTPKVNNHS